MLIFRKGEQSANRDTLLSSSLDESRELEFGVGILSESIALIDYANTEITKHENNISHGNLSDSEIRNSILEVDNTLTRLYGYCGSSKVFCNSGLLSSTASIEEYNQGLLDIKSFFVKIKENIVKFFKNIWQKLKNLWNKIFGSKETEKSVETTNQAVEEAKQNADEESLSKASQEASSEIVENNPIDVAKDIAILNLCILNGGYADMVEAVEKEYNGIIINNRVQEEQVKKLMQSQKQHDPESVEYKRLDTEIKNITREIVSRNTRLHYTQAEYEKNKELFTKQDALDKSLSSLYNKASSNGLVLSKIGFSIDVEGIGSVNDAVLIPFTSTPFVIFKNKDGLHLKTTHFKLEYSNKDGVVNTFKNCFTKIFGSKNQKDMLKQNLKVDKIMRSIKDISDKNGQEVLKNQQTVEDILNVISNNPSKEDRDLVSALCKMQSNNLIDLAQLTQGTTKSVGVVGRLCNMVISKVSKKSSSGE